MQRWAIFLSGTGSNFSALLELRRALNIVLVVSNKPQALGVLKAKINGVQTIIFQKEDSWADLLNEIEKMNITHVFLAGFMKIVPKEFIEKFKNRIYNIHPSMLPEYPGLKSIERAYNDKKNSGATIHVVTEGVDEGPILIQKKVPLKDSFDETEMFVHVTEHRLLREVFNA